MFALSCAKGDAYGAFAATVEAENTFIDEDNDKGAMSSASVMAKVANDDLRPHISISIKSLKSLIKRCWTSTASRRPTFEKILSVLEVRIRDEVFSSADKMQKDLQENAEKEEAVKKKTIQRARADV
ncbi:hypothetical protein ScalyP_jg4225, partial [Parmales sp. scaly parma]